MEEEIKNTYLPTSNLELPPDLKKEMKSAKRLEIITLSYLFTVVIVMYLTLSSSQAMKAAWVEDLLSMVPSTVFLISYRFYNKKANFRFPYGFHRVFSIGFAFGSFALLGIGAYIFIDSAITLIRAEHPTISHKEIFGHEIWFGWVMILALLYSSVPAVILGRKKIPKAKLLHNKLLYTDAETQKADWMTAAAAIVGIIGIGFGWWWADPVAAIFISASVVKDGLIQTKNAGKDFLGEIPTHTENEEINEINVKIIHIFRQKKWIKDVRIRLREEGQVFTGEAFIIPESDLNLTENISKIYEEIRNIDWKIHELTIQPVKNFDFEKNKEEEKKKKIK